MEEQSFQLLVSKLDTLEAGQSRIEDHLNARLSEQLLTIKQHIEDDKKLTDHIIALDKEITFAKGVTYTLNGATALVAGWFGLNK
jgi:hypothetical protein